ncbi:secreted protein [Candidatus Magnetobacterium bavaricum]|uniref:Secreted protein n=1 Tax=Candidatus Magnetobacterium bavaricum TaxID=29290 RepID=A0A0F3GRE8_9BACT|nr:secreted protein [Candidatus Magnetobacterium bavaricum]
MKAKDRSENNKSVYLALCLMWVFLLVLMIPNGAYSATTSALISSDDAVKIAEGFVKSRESKAGYEYWNGASFLGVQPFYSSNDVVIAYEVSFKSAKGDNAGYVMVYANKNAGVIQSFSPSGPSTGSQLKEFYTNVLKGEIEKAGLSVADEHFLLSSI